jgi:hypothetical protein
VSRVPAPVVTRWHRDGAGSSRCLSAAWNSVVDGLGDGGGEVDDLTGSVAGTRNMCIPWLRSNGDCLCSSGNDTSRLRHREGEGVGTGTRGNPSGREGSHSGRGNSWCWHRDPCLLVSQALGTEGTSTAFGNIDDLSSAAISLNTASLAETAAFISWNGQRTDLVVWSVEVLGNGHVDWGWCRHIDGSVNRGSWGGGNVFGQGSREH